MGVVTKERQPAPIEQRFRVDEEAVERVGDPLQIYLRDITKYPLLSTGQEAKLSSTILAGQVVLKSLWEISSSGMLTDDQEGEIVDLVARSGALASAGSRGNLFVHFEENKRRSRKSNHDKKVERLSLVSEKHKEWLVSKLRGFGKIEDLDRRQEAFQEVLDHQMSIVRSSQNSFESLVNSNLRWVVKLVFDRYMGRNVPVMDLIQFGNVGLTIAAARFDARRGFEFLSFAKAYIRKEIVAGIRETRLSIRVPQDPLMLLGQQDRLREELEKTEGREPTDEELAAVARRQSDLESISMAKSVRDVLSLDKPVGEDGDRFGDFVPSDCDFEEAVVSEEARQRVRDTLAFITKRILTPKQRMAVEAVYGINGQNGVKNGSRVDGLEKAALKRLRRYFELNGDLREELREAI